MTRTKKVYIYIYKNIALNGTKNLLRRLKEHETLFLYLAERTTPGNMEGEMGNQDSGANAIEFRMIIWLGLILFVI